MQFTQYLRTARKNWLVILVATLVGLALATTYSLTRTPLYQSVTTVFVSTQDASTPAELQQGSIFAQGRVKTYIELLNTPAVLGPVIHRLELATTPDQLARNIRATATLNSTLIDIYVVDTSAEQAAQIANSVAASLAAVVQGLEPEASDGTSRVQITQVRAAQPEPKPASPNTPINLSLGAIIGIVSGFVAASTRRKLDIRIRGAQDVEKILRAPRIGDITPDPDSADRPILVHADTASARAESFRTLRTNLQFIHASENASFVITSSLPNEGKSTTAINLAIVLADAGKRVALIDADLRRPKVSDYLSIEAGTGLTDLLIGRATIDDVVSQWGTRSLYVIPAGRVPPNPSELLGSDSMNALIRQLEEDFDVVLCDAPPLLPVTDAALLSRTAGSAIVVVSSRATRYQLVLAREALRAVGAQTSGFVMTMNPRRSQGGPPRSAYKQAGSLRRKEPRASHQ